MKKFIEVTRLDGLTVVVNVDHIQNTTNDKEANVVLLLGSTGKLAIKETLEEFIALLVLKGVK